MNRQDKNGPGEMDIGMHQIREVARHAGQGVRAVTWDGAMSGVHIDELMCELGLVVVSPDIAKSNPDGQRAGRKSDTRVEKECKHETVRFCSEEGSCKHVPYMDGGRLCEMITDGSGHDHLVPVKIDKVTRVGSDGAYRRYHELTVACPTNNREHGDGPGPTAGARSPRPTSAAARCATPRGASLPTAPSSSPSSWSSGTSSPTTSRAGSTCVAGRQARTRAPRRPEPAAPRAPAPSTTPSSDRPLEPRPKRGRAPPPSDPGHGPAAQAY